MPKIVSANRLSDGIVVYLGAEGAWLGALDEARVFTDATEAEAGLAAAREDARQNLVVDPFMVEVATGEGGLRPITLRNSIRAQGPTIDYAHRAGFDRISRPDRERPARDR
jgi:sulfite reductase (NADPH) hemoprotein beta-component